MAIFRRHLGIFFFAVSVLFCANDFVSACSIMEEAMPQIRETQKTINYLVYGLGALFVGIVGLYFLNLIVNQKWKLPLLFPFLAIVVLMLCFVYVVILTPMGLCVIDETFRATLTALIFFGFIFVVQFILFFNSIRNKNLKVG